MASPVSQDAGRVVPRAGRSRLIQTGLPRRPLEDLYHLLLVASWPRLVIIVTLLYLGSNGLFALGYLLGTPTNDLSRLDVWRDAFLFGIQTLSTTGQGTLTHQPLLAHSLVTLKTLTGLLGFAMVTGLVFAKFSRPTARVLFSRVAVIGPRDGVPSLMFRIANVRRNQIVEAQVHAAFACTERTAEGEEIRRFYDLPLVHAHNPIFALTWTVVHPLTDQSPLWGRAPAALAAMEAEVVVSLTGIEEGFSQTVYARFSYLTAEMVWQARFVDVVSRLPDGRRRIDFTHFHDIQRVPQ